MGVNAIAGVAVSLFVIGYAIFLWRLWLWDRRRT